MAGVGPAPKDPARRVRRAKGPDIRVVEYTPSSQPELPSGHYWPDETRAWWRMWAESPLAAEFSESDWLFLMDTAILHARLWGEGQVSVMPELRLRVAKFGATPEDRARLRIQFATADESEDRRDRRRVASSGSRARMKAAVQRK